MGREFLSGQLLNGCQVLLLVLRRAEAQVFARRVPILGMVDQGVEFVVPDDGKGVAGFDHRADDLEHLLNLWPSVDEIA